MTEGHTGDDDNSIFGDDGALMDGQHRLTPLSPSPWENPPQSANAPQIQLALDAMAVMEHPMIIDVGEATSVALERLQELEAGLNKTTIINRAVQLYALLVEARANEQKILITKPGQRGSAEELIWE